MTSSAAPGVDTNSISIFQKDGNNMRGIFSLLQSLGLSSRYSISSTLASDRGNPASNLDKYYQSDPIFYFSNSNDPSFQITFDSHFLLLGYSLSNYGSAGNTFPRDWSLYGTNSKDLTNLKLLDRHLMGLRSK